MPRSKHGDEIEFGSDSFLDVVANIVGILIILIVVAGIKAGQAAVSPEKLDGIIIVMQVEVDVSLQSSQRVVPEIRPQRQKDEGPEDGHRHQTRGKGQAARPQPADSSGCEIPVGPPWIITSKGYFLDAS